MRNTRTHHLMTLAVVALLAAGCGGSDGGDSGSPTASQGVDPTECGLEALQAASAPVEVTFWHVQAEADATNLDQLAAQFNASQSKVRVKLVQQPDYIGTMQKWQAGLATGDLPDVAQMEETTVQRLIDSKSTVPVAA